MRIAVARRASGGDAPSADDGDARSLVGRRVHGGCRLAHQELRSRRKEEECGVDPLELRGEAVARPSAALIAASGPSSPISPHTLNALFPSPPPAEPSDWSLRGLALGNGARRSRSRHELVALARGEGTAPRDRERTGPARALVDEWLVQGRDGMRRAVQDCGLRGEDAIRFGMRERIAYNEPVLDKLPQVRSLSPSPHSWSSERADPGALARRLSPSSRHHKAPTSRTRSRPSPCPTQPRTSLTSPTSPRTSQKRAAASPRACVSPSPSLLLLLLLSPAADPLPSPSLARSRADRLVHPPPAPLDRLRPRRALAPLPLLVLLAVLGSRAHRRRAAVRRPPPRPGRARRQGV